MDDSPSKARCQQTPSLLKILIDLTFNHERDGSLETDCDVSLSESRFVLFLLIECVTNIGDMWNASHRNWRETSESWRRIHV